MDNEKNTNGAHRRSFPRTAPDGASGTSSREQRDLGAPSPAPLPRFSIVTGTLSDVGGTQIRMRDAGTIMIEQAGETWELPVTLKDMGKPTNYLVVTRRRALACTPLAALLEERLPPSSSKNIEVHRIVAIAARGADFTLNGGRLAAHHVNLNGGDNRAGNLQTVSTATHDRLHRDHIDRDVAAYLASLAAAPDGTAGMGEHLCRALAADLAAFEGQAFLGRGKARHA